MAVSVSSNLNLGWDAKYFYYIKSLFFVEGLGLNELGSFEHNKWHPHFGSYLWAFFWGLPFIEIEYFGRLSYLFIFCFSIYFVTNFDSKNYKSNLLYIALLILLFKYERFSGLQEILIFSFLAISSKILYQLKGGLKSSMGYIGAKNLNDIKKNAKFIKITKAGFYESMVHSVEMIEPTLNYKL